MYRKFKKLLIGRPLKTKELDDEKLNVFWGLPILSSDAISSVAYAGQEILMVLIPAIGILAYEKMSIVSAAIVGLLILLTISYRQTIDSYPNGGGAFIVAKENLGKLAGVTAGAALSIDYILTVAVSISSGVEQITSAFSALKAYSVPICILIVILIMIGNLRGLKEASKMFGIPAYAFMSAIILMIIVGVVKSKGIPVSGDLQVSAVKGTEGVGLILLLRAFSSGCSALTGVEAVSNAVPNFKSPSTKHAKKVLALLSLIVFVLFGGTVLLAYLYHPTIGDKAMLMQMAETIFGRGFLFYYVMTTTFVILALAANTAYSGFPLLVAVMAQEGYVPRQLSMRGDRLSFSNGIIVLTVVAAILIIFFDANVSRLIGLYAIGVFISFTLSQAGMFVKWVRQREDGWVHKAFVNGIGAIVTFVAVVIIGVTKFHEGAWLVVVLIPILIFFMLKIKKHYITVAKQLAITTDELEGLEVHKDSYINRVIVPIQSINKSSMRALKYARTISDNVIAFSVALDEESKNKILEKYSHINTDIPLIVKYSPFRKVVEPLLDFIESKECDHKQGNIITIVLPQFKVKSLWHKILHNNSGAFIERELLKHKHIVVATIPLQLKDLSDL